MKNNLRVAFLWHFHQPVYKEPHSGLFALPWVRLHGVKDYYDMGSMLKEHEAIKATFNFVPSLVEQLLEYASDDYIDRFEESITTDPSDMPEADKVFFLQNIFNMHGPKSEEEFPRLAELKALWQKYFEQGKEERIASMFDDQTILDLQVMHLLAWCGGSLKKQVDVVPLLQKDGKYSIEDKRTLLEHQHKTIQAVIPLFTELRSSGQLELSTSPRYHPILPLLIDNDYGRRSDRFCEETSIPFVHPEDAMKQIELALDYHQAVFGERPRGMWPSEGSICYEVVEMISKEGLQWCATDDMILEASVGRIPRLPERYLPHRVRGISGDTVVFFRDHQLSDLIGFVYSRWGEKKAVADFVRRLMDIRSQLPDDDKRYVVPIILDGENAWEYYPDNGTRFFRELYKALTDSQELETVTFSDCLDDINNLPELETISPGSWIDGNFNTWIGQEEKNRAWDALAEARQSLEDYRNGHDVEKEPCKSNYESAYRDILIAEGSDWFWWYGRGHSSPQDPEFDSLFRSRLQHVYELLGLDVPEVLLLPIGTGIAENTAEPAHLFTPVLDGCETTFYEWKAAGHWALEEGAAHKATAILSRILYGFDLNYFYLRFDGDLALIKSSEEKITLELVLVKPAELTVTIELFDGDFSLTRNTDNTRKDIVDGSVVLEDVIELKIRLLELGLKGGEKLNFYAKLSMSGEVLERLPGFGLIHTQVPTEDFESKRWYV